MILTTLLGNKKNLLIGAGVIIGGIILFSTVKSFLPKPNPTPLNGIGSVSPKSNKKAPIKKTGKISI